MRFYNSQHQYYCGIDLHARSMYLHVLDQQGQTLFDKDLPAGPDVFRAAVAPFRQGLVVGCECMFAWYWLADLCEDEAIPFALGHAVRSPGTGRAGLTPYGCLAPPGLRAARTPRGTTASRTIPALAEES